ncbi:MAG: metallophosphoesterase [Acidobacteriaceae bacterium]|nr:metallophosphoesterase [Acidobacteriaceae bacterium]
MIATKSVRLSLLSLLVACSIAVATAQSPASGNPAAPVASAKPSANVPALLLSDVHLDPFADPAKVAKLNAAPAAEWPAILSAPASPTEAQDFAALQKSCPTRGIDTSWVLWQSSLAAIHANAAQAKFITLSGDLLAHSFDCKYKALLPKASPADYTAFTEKTIRTIATTLRAALPGVPLYIAMGNNDSGCADYALDATHDAFLGLVAKVIGESLPADLAPAERAAAVSDFAAGGNYSVPLAAVPHTRLLVIDDLFFSGKYATCSGKTDPAPAAAQLAWLAEQIAHARQQHERVWVMGHIPPGVDLYATARKFANVCAGAKPQMFLANESMANLLAQNADVVRLALFGHTHADEMRLLTPESVGQPSPASTTPNAVSTTPNAVPAAVTLPAAGVPLKVVASITPVNGNRPTFTLASIDPATASLADYTVVMASNTTGLATIWVPEYTYSTTYHEPAFDAASLSTLIPALEADPAAKTPASQAYLRNYFPGDLSKILQLAWPQYTCSLAHDSAAAFAACACAK